MNSKFYVIPFADGGDKQVIPDKPVDNRISFQSGYTANYSLDPMKNKDGLYVDRLTFNYLSYVATSALIQRQRTTFSQWFGNAEYPAQAIVSHNGNIYENTIDGNTAEPNSESSGWVTAFSGQYPIGAIIKWIGKHNDVSYVPDGYAECNGASFDVDKYPKLANIFTNGKLPDLRGFILKGVTAKRDLLSIELSEVGDHDHCFGLSGASKVHKHDTSKLKQFGTASGMPLVRGDAVKDSCLTQRIPAKIIKITNLFSGDKNTIRMNGFLLDTDLIDDRDKIKFTDVAKDHTHEITINQNTANKGNKIDSVAIKYLVRMS